MGRLPFSEGSIGCGVTADFSGHYGSKVTPSFLELGGQPLGLVKDTGSFTSYLFGPHFTYRRSRYAPFVETLFGLHYAWRAGGTGG